MVTPAVVCGTWSSTAAGAGSSRATTSETRSVTSTSCSRPLVRISMRSIRRILPHAYFSKMMVYSCRMLVDTLPPLTGRDFLRVEDLSTEEMVAVLDLADELKAMQGARIPHALLPGRTLGLIFQKASTRTRVSFEVGMYQLGGSAVHLSAAEMQLGRGEPIRDTGIVLGRYLDAIMIRANSHADVEELAAASTAPVINGLTELHHPARRWPTC